MAASIDNRNQPENSEGEQREQRSRPRSRKRRNRVKQLLGQEVTRLPSASPPASRPTPVPIKQLTPRQTGTQAVTRSRPHLRQLQPDSQISNQRPQLRANPSPELLQNPNPKEYRTQESGYTRAENKSVSTPRINPWEVKSKSIPLNPPPPSTPPYQGGARGGQNPKSIDASRGRKGRDLFKTLASGQFKPLSEVRNRRRERNQSRIAETVISAPTQVGTTGARRERQGSSSQSSQSQRKRISRRPQKRPLGPLVYIIRLLILGIGIGAIAGTLLSALDPSTQASVKAKDTAKSEVQESPKSVSRSTPLPVGQEIPALKAQIQTLVAQNSTLQPGVFIVDLDTGAYLDWEGRSTFASASTIKVPILVAFFQDVDAGKIRLDEPLTLKPEMIADGSGDLQYKQPGTQYSALEVATKMITISDNTATNMLIARLGGAEALNQRFRAWGLTTTVLRNRLPDVEGTNTSSPRELANLMSVVNQGELVSLRSRDRLLDIMQRTETNSMLPKGLGLGATIAHKTGTIGSLLADVGLVDMPSGKRYIVAVMVKRPHNDASAEELIRKISRTAYDYFNQPHATPSTTSMPSGSTGTITRAIAPENSVN